MALLRIAFLSLIAVLAAWLPALSQPVDGGHARVELVSERALAVPGETVWFGLSFEIDPNWHIYWRNAGDAGIPPEITWRDVGGVAAEQVGGFAWPLPELLPVVPGQIMDYGYSDQVVLPFMVTLPDDAEGPLLFEGVADYLICEDVCIPESADIRLLLSVGGAQIPDQYGSDLIQASLASVPPEFSGDARLSDAGDAWVLSVDSPELSGLQGNARFFPYNHEIKHAADQAASFGPEGLQLRLTPDREGDPLPETIAGVVKVGETAVAISADAGPVLPGTSRAGGFSTQASGAATSLPVLMAFALIGGLILNLMPCVLPVLSIKAMGVVSASASGHEREARAHGLWYAAGVLASFGALAAAVLSVRAATGVAIWGFWLQNPILVTALILIIFLIGLWLLGMFELGTSVQAVGSDLAAKQGSAGAFFTGVLAAVVGAPCTGPFLGAALGAVMLQPSINVVLVLLTMGLGMALPFLALSFLPGLQKMIPKPGAWMETLKQVFAFPMFLTAAWLLSVLGAQAGNRMVAMVVAGAALIAFGIWALKAAGQGAKSILLSILGLAVIVPAFGLITAMSGPQVDVSGAVFSMLWIVALVVAFVGVAQSSANVSAQTARGLAGLAIIAGLVWPLAQARTALTTERPSTAYAAKYETEAWSPERVAELTSEGRAVFVDFTAEWCVTCQANKLQTLQTRPVTEAFAAGNVAFLVADFTNGDKTIALELQKHNRAGVPMYLWYAPGETQPHVLPELLSIDLVTGLVDGAG
ncbi:MAG: protein-disulfide reductase DsbD family protein [Hyphomonadaceae bacterium]|nr:protein-disulfide reductase DsbD family protein [Hyphomonadaceae bacterium]